MIAETFSIRRQEGSRSRLRRMRVAMEFESTFVRKPVEVSPLVFRIRRNVQIDGKNGVQVEVQARCRPQKVDLTLCSSFFEPVFSMESTKNVFHPDPAIGG